MKITSSPFTVFLFTATFAATAVHASIFTQIDEGSSHTAFDSNITAHLIRNGESTLASMVTSHASYNGFPASGLNDGSAASNSNLTYYSIRNPSGGASSVWLPVTITFTLTGSLTGYDISSIQTIAGWSDPYLGDQKFQLRLSVNGGKLTDYGTCTSIAALNGGNNSTMVTLADDSGPIASGMTGLQFVLMNPKTTQGGSGGTVIHQLQAFGTPTSGPKPQVWGLVGTGLALIATAARRHRRKSAFSGPNADGGVPMARRHSVTVFSLNRTGSKFLHFPATMCGLPFLRALAVITTTTFCHVAFAELRILPLGDSITEGDGGSGRLIPGGYRDPLARALNNANIPFQFVGDSASNPSDYLTSIGQDRHSGHGGWRIDQIQSNITNWQQSFLPDVILLHIGTNDILQNRNLGTGVGFDTSNAIARLTTLLDTLYSNNSSLNVILSTLIPIDDSRNDYVKNYNAFLTSTVVPHFLSLGRSITLVDNYANFVTDTGAVRADLYDNTNVHPNAAGYQKMADAWFSAIKNTLVPPDPPAPPSPPATLHSTSQVSAGTASLDGKIRTNLVRAGASTLESVTVSHDPSLSGTFKTTGLNDGSATASSNLTYYAVNEPTGNLPATITFTLQGSASGYDITSIESLAGWKDSNIGDQKFQLLLSIRGDDFLDYGTYSATGALGDFASLVTVTDESGRIASGVTGVRFVYLNPDGTQGGNGGTVIRELQVFGTASAVPEPSAIALLGAGALGLVGWHALSRSRRPISR